MHMPMRALSRIAKVVSYIKCQSISSQRDKMTVVLSILHVFWGQGGQLLEISALPVGHFETRAQPVRAVSAMFTVLHLLRYTSRARSWSHPPVSCKVAVPHAICISLFVGELQSCRLKIEYVYSEMLSRKTCLGRRLLVWGWRT